MPRAPETLAVELAPADDACLRAHAELALPRESCGLLLGEHVGDVVRVRRLRPTANGAAEAQRFRIHPHRVLEAMVGARVEGMTLVGSYHSHPRGGGLPSAADRCDAWGELLQLIVACRNGVALPPRAWSLIASGSEVTAREVPVRIADRRAAAS